jgi:hypothetical protein
MKALFYKSMEKFNILYKKKYGYPFDYPKIVNHSCNSVEQYINFYVTDLAFWKYFINGYNYKPNENTKNMKHLRGYYCYIKYEILKLQHFNLILLNFKLQNSLIEKLDLNITTNKSFLRTKIIIKKLDKMVNSIKKNEIFKKEKRNIIEYDLPLNKNIHENIYSFLE